MAVYPAWGEPVYVNSGWRCAPRNLKVGGTPTSRHLIGCAADIRSFGKMDTEFIYLVNRLFDAIVDREYVKYDTFLHVAVPRGEIGNLWDGNAGINF